MQAIALPEYREHIGACSECGNSPVNHFATYCEQTFAVFTAGRDNGSRIRAWIDTAGDALFEKISPALFGLLAVFPATRFSRDPSHARTYRSQVIWEEAARRGIAMEQIVFFGSYTEIYRARIGPRWRYFQSLPIPPHLSHPPYRHIDDKFRLKAMLSAHGIPVPLARSVTTRAQAVAVFHEIGGAVVVKPRSGSRGRHTTVNVRNDADLVRAFDSAQRLCRYVVVEPYLSGSVCRATLVEGKLAGFLQADPPTVSGDGTSTVRELVVRANSTKPDRVQDIVLGEDHRSFLSRMGLTFDSVIDRDARVALTYRTGRLFGGRTREHGREIHPKLRDHLERAAVATRAAVIGFDLVIEDPLADPDTQSWGIIEGNSLPFIDLHYLPLVGTPSPVAAELWDLWSVRTDPAHKAQ